MKVYLVIHKTVMTDSRDNSETMGDVTGVFSTLENAKFFRERGIEFLTKNGIERGWKMHYDGNWSLYSYDEAGRLGFIDTVSIVPHEIDVRLALYNRKGKQQ